MATLELEGVTKRYGRHAILQDAHLVARRGALTLLSGRSGSGKSTLLAIAAGLEPPDEGTVRLDGTDLGALGPDERAAFRLQRIGVVLQHHELIPDLTAVENVQLPLELAGRKETAKTRAYDLLKSFHVGHVARAFPETLSGGERQRVSIARAMANDPAAVIADEPTASLDAANARTVMNALRWIAARGRIVLVATHDPLALPFADARYGVRDGLVRPLGTRTGPVPSQIRVPSRGVGDGRPEAVQARERSPPRNDDRDHTGRHANQGHTKHQVQS